MGSLVNSTKHLRKFFIIFICSLQPLSIYFFLFFLVIWDRVKHDKLLSCLLFRLPCILCLCNLDIAVSLSVCLLYFLRLLCYPTGKGCSGTVRSALNFSLKECPMSKSLKYLYVGGPDFRQVGEGHLEQALSNLLPFPYLLIG